MSVRAKSGHSCYRETERNRQPRPNRGIKVLTAAGCDLTAVRAAALDLQQADQFGKGLCQVGYQASNWLGGLGSVARYFTILTAMFGHPRHSKVRPS
jgi:hypothetical protein